MISFDFISPIDIIQCQRLVLSLKVHFPSIYDKPLNRMSHVISGTLSKVLVASIFRGLPSKIVEIY